MINLSFIGKGGGGNSSSLNIFLQQEEPASKEGIWIKKDAKYNKVVIGDDVSALPVWNKINLTSLVNSPGEYASRAYAFIGDVLYLFGMDSTKNKSVKIELSTNKITNLADTPVENIMLAQVVGDIIYIFAYDKSIYKYNVAENTYEKVEGVTCPFASVSRDVAIAGVGTDIYLFFESSTYKFNTVSNEITTLKSIPYDIRTNACATVNPSDNNIIYLFLRTNTPLHKVYEYNIKDNTYTQIYSVSPSTTGDEPANVLICKQNKLYMFQIDKQRYQILDLETKEYETKTDIPAIHKGKIGGLLPNGNIVLLNDISKDLQTLSFPVKSYDANTVVIQRGNLYETQLLNPPAGTEGRVLSGIDNAWHFTDEGIDTATGLAYGNGASWVDIR